MKRRLLIVGPDGRPLYPYATRKLMLEGKRVDDLGPVAAIDVSDIPNADARSPMMLALEEQCDHGHWHEISRQNLPNWDDDAWRDAKPR